MKTLSVGGALWRGLGILGIAITLQACDLDINLNNTSNPTNSSGSTSPSPSPSPSPAPTITPSAMIPPASEIIDSENNVWTVDAGVVLENGEDAGYSADVILLLYYSGVIYQENSSDQYYAWTGSTWMLSPNPLLAPTAVSASGAAIPPASQLVDSSHNIWTVSGGVIYENNALAGYSANVILLLYYDGVIYQENSSDQFYAWSGGAWVSSSDPETSGSSGGAPNSSPSSSPSPSPSSAPSDSPPPSSANYVGVNLNSVSYYTPEQPFLNIFKQAGSNYSFTGWSTHGASGNETGEEPYLASVLDSNGYPTTLSVPGIPGGQQFTSVITAMNYQLGTPPGASVPYPAGSYTLQFQGEGTIALGFDVASGTLATSSPNCSVSGLTITSTMSSGQTCTVTFTVTTPDNGITFGISALPSSTNYIRNVSIVQTAYQSAYEAGELFSPQFKAMLTHSGNGGYSRLRFMWWENGVAQEWYVDYNANLAQGATSGTISSMGYYNGSYTTWPFPSGTYTFVFADGQVIPVKCTYGSASLTWSTPLSAAISKTPNSPNVMSMYVTQPSWSSRPQLSNAFWGLQNGVPYEAMTQLCNEVGADCWINLPMGAQYVTNGAYATSLAQLIYNGTGASLTGSTLASFSGLNSDLKAYIEDSNEVWNTGTNYGGDLFARMIGPIELPNAASYNAPLEWMGAQQAGISDTFYGVYGASAFANRVVTVMGGQFAIGNGTYYMEQAMNTPDWTSAAYTHHIGAITYAPYFGTAGVSAADATTILASANPLDTYFGLAYSNTYGGQTYSSVPSDGYLGSTISTESSLVSSLSSQPWAKLPVVGYEAGTSNQTIGTPAQNVSGWLSLIEEVHRDQRFAYLYYDPSHQLSSNPGYLPASAAAGFQSLNQFTDVGQMSGYGEWGALENVMQTISPLSSAPPKYQGIMNYVGE